MLNIKAWEAYLNCAGGATAAYPPRGKVLLAYYPSDAVTARKWRVRVYVGQKYVEGPLMTYRLARDFGARLRELSPKKATALALWCNLVQSF